MTGKKATKSSTKKTVAPVDILVGKKPTMNYVLYIINQAKDAKQIVIKARGKAIHKAVDVVEILRRRFITSLKVEKIEIDTTEVEDAEKQRKRRISTIEITVSK